MEKLAEYGIEPGTMDTVTSVKVLCSVPRPAALVKDLYRLLKPGGQMIVYEHVKSEDYMSQLVQRMYFRPTPWLRTRIDIAEWFITSSGHTRWAIASWIVLLGSTCLRVVVGPRSSWKRRKRKMLGWSFRMFMGDWWSGGFVQRDILWIILEAPCASWMYISQDVRNVGSPLAFFKNFM